MKKMILIALVMNISFGFAEESFLEITNSKRIENALSKFPDLTNKIMAKSLTTGELVKVDKLVVKDSGEVWDANGAGFDCTLKVEAYSFGNLVGQIKREYSDTNCPDL